MDSEMAATMDSEMVVAADGDDTKSEKRIRKRKKQLHQALRTQMEFYFSDSNLMKDKFLGKLLAENEDGWVALDVFFHFNKIRSYNCSVKDICRALKKSELLEISPDDKSVRRQTPASVKENVDQCTLYVENLPPDVDHDWLRSVFTPFGTIDYISLPRFKQKNTVKGFAFIEFSSPKEAFKACKHFGYLEDENRIGGDDTMEQTPRPKRKRGTSESDDSGKKRVRQSSLSETSTKDPNAQVSRSNPEEPTSKMSEEESTVQDEASTKKKKKKRSRKKKRKSQETQEKPIVPIRVMPKEEWKRWKNKYLSMQKATMSQIKLSLSGVEPPMPLKEVKESRQVGNQPTLEGKDTMEEKKIRNRDVAVQFVEGTIIKIKMKEPVTNPAELKAQLRNLGNVAYVELQEGERSVHVRCKNSEEAQRILSEAELPGKARLLEGEEEKSYWEKLQADRQAKLSSHPKRKRGSEKVLTKVVKQHNTHVVFDT